MENLELFEVIRKDYYQNVKPKIEREDFYDAGIEIGKLEMLMRLDERYRVLVSRHHNGLNFLTRAQILKNDLLGERINHEKIKISVREFEAYLEQLSLAVKSGNKYA